METDLTKAPRLQQGMVEVSILCLQKVCNNLFYRWGISQVTLSRIGMASPGMLLIPVLMNSLERRGLLARYPRLLSPAPLQTLLCGLSLLFTTPLCCALFEQEAPIRIKSLEPDVRDRLVARGFSDGDTLYYNKGL